MSSSSLAIKNPDQLKTINDAQLSIETALNYSKRNLEQIFSNLTIINKTVQILSDETIGRMEELQKFIAQEPLKIIQENKTNYQNLLSEFQVPEAATTIANSQLIKNYEELNEKTRAHSFEISQKLELSVSLLPKKEQTKTLGDEKLQNIRNFLQISGKQINDTQRQIEKEVQSIMHGMSENDLDINQMSDEFKQAIIQLNTIRTKSQKLVEEVKKQNTQLETASSDFLQTLESGNYSQALDQVKTNCEKMQTTICKISGEEIDLENSASQTLKTIQDKLAQHISNK